MTAKTIDIASTMKRCRGFVSRCDASHNLSQSWRVG
jgi:hypothetical protein